MTTHRIGDVLPNPFRDIENCPFVEAKIETLWASFRNTSVWPTIVARLTDGHPEIAFGHHRLEAARREYGPDGMIPVPIEAPGPDEVKPITAPWSADELGGI
jgi:hypothetical protein